MDMRLCRKIFASHLIINEGIQPDVVDLLSGRVPQSIFTRHYLVPQNSFKEKVLDAMEKLKQEIEQ